MVCRSRRSESSLTKTCPAEPFNDDGTYRVDIFFNTLNTTYIPLALKAARRADPHTKLYINDFGIEGTGTPHSPQSPSPVTFSQT